MNDETIITGLSPPQPSPSTALSPIARYALSRWDALTHYIEDGHIEIDRSTTTPPNALCAACPWDGRTTCSRDRIRAGSYLQPNRFRETQ
jgi:hypothetical protein